MEQLLVQVRSRTVFYHWIHHCYFGNSKKVAAWVVVVSFMAKSFHFFQATTYTQRTARTLALPPGVSPGSCLRIRGNGRAILLCAWPCSWLLPRLRWRQPSTHILKRGLHHHSSSVPSSSPHGVPHLSPIIPQASPYPVPCPAVHNPAAVSSRPLSASTFAAA